MIIERVITVEYLEPSMSQTLLGKFPDDSAFGFDYSESGIWSPLLPRGWSGGGSGAFGSSEMLLRTKAKAMKRRRKKKLNGVNKRLDFSPNPIPKRGWNWLLKAMTRRFKLQKRAAMQMILPTL